MTDTPAFWSRCHSAAGSSVPRSFPSDSAARRSSPAAASASIGACQAASALPNRSISRPKRAGPICLTIVSSTQ